MPRSEEEQFIEGARRLLKPGEVKLHTVPTWLNVRLRAYRKARLLDRLPSSMLLTMTIGSICSDPGWLDHHGASTTGPFKCCHQMVNLVSEPYDFGSETACALDTFCRVLGGLEWHVSSNTWWYPGSTVRITIHEKVD